MIYIQILAMLGMILSVYSLYVEKRLERQKDYAPVCDISKKYLVLPHLLASTQKL